MKRSFRYCERDLILGPCVALILNEKDFHREVKRIAPTEPSFPMLNAGAHATCHSFRDKKGTMTFLVTLDGALAAEKTGIQIASLLMHEAVHIWQSFSEDIGEKEPSREFEAYSIQSIAQRLMYEYARQTNA